MIYVLGSINNEIVLELERMPKKGESTVAEGGDIRLGGKGFNQAVAIAKLKKREEKNSPTVKLIAQVGNDAIGDEAKRILDSYGVDTAFVRSVRRPTGTVVTTVAKKDKRTVVYGGANSNISKTDIDEALASATSEDTLLCQLDCPLYVVMYALSKAHALGMTTILNPAPAKFIPDDVYCNVDVIVPNAEEAHVLTGINPVDFQAQKSAMQFFHAHGVQYVVITLGDNGCSLSDGAYIVSHIPPRKTEVVDRTCVGDTFVGALAVTYPRIGMYSFEEACVFAGKAAAIALAREGGIESIPAMSEVVDMYNRIIK